MLFAIVFFSLVFQFTSMSLVIFWLEPIIQLQCCWWWLCVLAVDAVSNQDDDRGIRLEPVPTCAVLELTGGRVETFRADHPGVRRPLYA